MQRLITFADATELGGEIASEQVRGTAEMFRERGARLGGPEVANQSDYVWGNRAALSEIDPDDAAALTGGPGENGEPSAGGAAEIEDAGARADEPKARNYFFELEGGAGGKAVLARAAIEFIVRLIARHKDLWTFQR